MAMAHRRDHHAHFTFVPRRAVDPEPPSGADPSNPTSSTRRSAATNRADDTTPSTTPRPSDSASPPASSSTPTASSSRSRHSHASSDSDSDSSQAGGSGKHISSSLSAGSAVGGALSPSNSLRASHPAQVGGPPALSQTALIAIIAGASVVALLVIASGLWYCTKRRKQKREENMYWGVRPNGKPSSLDGRLLASAQPQRLHDDKDMSISDGSYELEKRSTGTHSGAVPMSFDRDSEKSGGGGGKGGMWMVLKSSDSEKRRKAEAQERLWDPPSAKEELERKEREKLRMTLAAMDLGPDVKSNSPRFQNFTSIDTAAGVNGLGPNGWERSNGQVRDLRPRMERGQAGFKPGETKVALRDGPSQDDPDHVEEVVVTPRLIKGREEETTGALAGKNKKTDTIAGFMDAYGWDSENESPAPPLPPTSSTKAAAPPQRNAGPLLPAVADANPFAPSEVSTEYSVSDAQTALADSSINAGGWLHRSPSGMSDNGTGRRKPPPAPLDLTEHDQAERDLENMLKELDPRSKRPPPTKTVDAVQNKPMTLNPQPSRKVLSPVPEMPSPQDTASPLRSDGHCSPIESSLMSSAQSKNLTATIPNSAGSGTLKAKLALLNPSDQEFSKSYGSVAPPGRFAMGRGDSVYSYRAEEMGEYPNGSSVGTPAASPCRDDFPLVPPSRSNVSDPKAKDTNFRKRASSFYGLSYTRESVDIPPPPALPFPPPLSPFSTSPLPSPGLSTNVVPATPRTMGSPLVSTFSRSESRQARPEGLGTGSLHPDEAMSNVPSRGISINTTGDMYSDIGSALLSATSPSMKTDWTFGSSAPPSPHPPTPDTSDEATFGGYAPKPSSNHVHSTGKRDRIGPDDVVKAGFVPLDSMKVSHFNEVDRDSVYGMYDDYLSTGDDSPLPATRNALR